MIFLSYNNFPQFSNVAATSEYCRAIDRIFDFLNSKSKFSKGFKSPIFKSNIHTSECIIIPLIRYLYSLKFKGLPLYTSNKKTFIIGFSIAVKSMFSIAKELFIVSPFTYILTYKFSQDHIELLFGRVRQRFGANNNPNVTQFKTAIKQILLKMPLNVRVMVIVIHSMMIQQDHYLNLNGQRKIILKTFKKEIQMQMKIILFKIK